MRATNATLSLLLGAAALLMGASPVAGQNVPYSESFESFTNGHPIALEPGWTADGEVFVTTNPAVIGALTNASLFPLAGPHEKALRLGGAASNSVAGVTGGVVTVDYLVMPARRTFLPDDAPESQAGVCAGPDGRLALWHRNTTGTPVDEWRTLTNSPVLATNEWARITLRQDHAAGMFQVSVNGAVPLIDDAGWTSNNGAQPGSWFHMVNTNTPALNEVCFAGGKVSHLDDLVVSDRRLVFSTNAFREALANDGTINNAQPLTIALAWDTFDAVPDEDLAANPAKLWVTNLPSGLTLSAVAGSPTQLTVTVGGGVSEHEAYNSVSNVTFIFGDAAFSLGRAWDVAGATTTNLAVAFESSSVVELSCDNLAFAEEAANDGRVGGAANLTLVGKDFAGTNGEDFVISGRVTSSNLPPGLALSVVRTGLKAATLGFTDRASAHAASNSVSDVTVIFGDTAFVGGNAAAVSNAVRSGFQITFLDPPVVTPVPAGFTEAAPNDGTIGNSVALNLTGTLFAPEAVFTNGTHYTVGDLPAGLSLAVARASDTQLTVSLNDAAWSHATADSTNLVIVLRDEAFQVVGASNIVGAMPTLSVAFADPPALSWSGTSFAESATNDGAVATAIALALEGAAFAAGPFTEGTHFSAEGVPAGLSPEVARLDASQAVVRLVGQASPHTSASGGPIAFAFSNAAFQVVAATNIAGSTNTLGVTFLDPPWLTYEPLSFIERGDDIGALGNSVAIALTGASFTEGALLSNVAYTVTGVPPGLTFGLTRQGDSLVTASLAGQAAAHSNVNDTVIGLTFLDAAFQVVGASNILGVVTNLTVNFVDLPPANTVPFTDSFESYPNGFEVVGTNGWLGGTADAGVVTNDSERLAGILAYGPAPYPLNEPHTQILQVQTAVVSRTRSVAGRMLFADCLAYIQGRDAPPDAGAGDQSGLYVNTNQQVVIWHQNRSGAPTNEWRTLENTTVATGAWHRITICQNYERGMFKVKVDGATLSDAAGWSVPGGNQPGPWFFMVQTNGYLSEVFFAGGKADRPIHIEDVLITHDDLLPVGSVFRFR